MKKVFIPGINGLGRTLGVEKKNIFIEKDFEKIKLSIGNIEKQLKEILVKSKKYFNCKERVLFVGGDHSISYPLVLNFFEKFENNSKLLIFDAHPDLMHPMKEPSHEEWLRAIIEKGFNPKNLLLVGVRKNSKNIDKSEFNYAKTKGINFIFVEDFEKKKKDILNFMQSGIIYVSFDIDVFDCSIISSTGYPEKNGLNENQIFSLFKKIKNKIRFFDLVEINFDKGNKESKKKTKKIVGKILKILE